MNNQYKPNWNNQKNGYEPKGGNHGSKADMTSPAVLSFKLYKDKDGKKVVDADLFDKKAREIAESFKGISSTRMRRFFDSVKMISRRPDFKSRFDEVSLPEIKLLKSKCAYMIGRAAGADERNNLKNLKQFISNGVDQVACAEDYQVFVSVFEAVYGFFYEKAPKNS